MLNVTFDKQEIFGMASGAPKGTTVAEPKKKFTPKETDPEIDAKAIEKLVTARIALLFKAPFFGSLAIRLKLVNADSWCPTLAVDGHNFYYNSEFVMSLPPKQLEFGVGHEVLHVAYDHMGRREHRIPKLHNIAADYCVNGDLIKHNIGERITVVPILVDAKYDGWSSEDVYDDLYKNAEKIDMDSLLEKLLDEHLDGEEEEDGAGGAGGKGNKPKYTAEERKTMRDEMRDAVIQAAQAAEAAGSPGNVPAGIKRMIHALTNPQLSWREIIRQQIQSLVKTDFTWMRPSRRSWHMDAIFPGSDFAETIDVCLTIDASGSMTAEMLRDILSETKGIMQSFDDFKLQLWSFDTKVYNHTVFTPDNIDEIDTWEVMGGGGTDFECNWDFMKDNEISPKLFIMFTDGYPCGGWGDPDFCDTLFVIHGNFKGTAPFGDTVQYELEKMSGAK